MERDDRLLGCVTNSMSTGLFVLGQGLDDGRHRFLANHVDRHAWPPTPNGSPKTRSIQPAVKERNSSGREGIQLVGREE